MKWYLLSSLFFLFFINSCRTIDKDVRTSFIDQELDKVETKVEKLKIIDDSLKKVMSNDKLTLKYLSLKSKYLSKYQEYDRAIKITEKQISIARQINDSNRVTEAYYKLGLYNRNIRKFTLALHYFDSCLISSRVINNTLYEAKANTNIGSIYKRNDSLEKSFYYYNEAFNNYELLHDSIEVAGKLLQMANIQKRIGDFSGSLETAVEGLDYSKGTKGYRTFLDYVKLLLRAIEN